MTFPTYATHLKKKIIFENFVMNLVTIDVYFRHVWLDNYRVSNISG